jgi:hypothetical protein
VSAFQDFFSLPECPASGDLIPASECVEVFWLKRFEFWMNGCSSSLFAVGLSVGFLLKQPLRKSFPSNDKLSGIGGSLFNTLNIAAGPSRPLQGGLPVNISIIVQPRLQISTARS